MYKKSYKIILTCFLLATLAVSCHHKKKQLAKKEIVTKPADMDRQVSEDIEVMLAYALDSSGKIDDSTWLSFITAVDSFYNGNHYNNIWSKKEKFLPLADSLYRFIEHSELDGLYPEDYHFKTLSSLIDRLDKDSASRTDAILWTKADVLLTDGFMHLVKDLRQGRLPHDSISLNKDSILTDSFFASKLNNVLATRSISAVLDSLEPSVNGYRDLKAGLKDFLNSMDRKSYTYLEYRTPAGKDDSAAFSLLVMKRLKEGNLLNDSTGLSDSLMLNKAVKAVQKKASLKQDGKISAQVVRMLNDFDRERFRRIAMTMDKFKLLPDTMPVRYIWVNLPEFYLEVRDHDTVAIRSKIVCGKPLTRSPLLNSAITNMVTYPTWTVPNSIIVKQYLPRLQKDATYLSHIGLNIVDKNGNTVDATTVNWKKYKKGIPYKIVQGSGDDNALGILKFNFNNKYSVYLHDTNERWLFNDSVRSLSHGCIRVQEWQQLAFFILRNDSITVASKPGGRVRYNTDSLVNILGRKEKKTIYMYNRLPLFIRYFTCKGQNGKVIFYDDIYGEDKLIRDKYFTQQ